MFVSAPIAGQLDEKLDPRMILAVGFRVLRHRHSGRCTYLTAGLGLLGTPDGRKCSAASA